MSLDRQIISLEQEGKMIKNFVESFEKNKSLLASKFGLAHPKTYKDIVTSVIHSISDAFDDDNLNPDPNRVYEIKQDDREGALVYVIASKGDTPLNFWYVKILYGSCSACDTLEGIREYSEEKPNNKQIANYMTLALHIVQKLKKMDGDIVIGYNAGAGGDDEIDELCAEYSEKLAEYSERRAEYDAMRAEYSELSSKLGRYVVHDYNILLKFDDDQTEKNSTG